MDKGGLIFLLITSGIMLAGLCWSRHRIRILESEVRRLRETHDQDEGD